VEGPHDICIVLTHDGGSGPITFIVTDPRDDSQTVVVLNAGDPPEVVCLAEWPCGIFTIPVTANGANFDQVVDVVAACCCPFEVVPEVECVGNDTEVTLCFTTEDCSVDLLVVNPATSEPIVVEVGPDDPECVALTLPCGQEWEVEVYWLEEGYEPYPATTVQIEACPCPEICPTPLDIQGFTLCRSGGLLGTGSDLRVLLVNKGATGVIAELQPASGQFSRILDGTSELTMEGVVGGRLGEICCEGWEEIRTWATEIVIYRGGRDAWAGPVTDVSFDYGRVRITAADTTAWWDRRTVPDLSFSNTDLTDIALAIHEAAMKPDPSPNLRVVTTPSGVVGARTYNGQNYQYASDAIAELAATGLDFTAYGRTIIMGGEADDLAPIATLIDDHWVAPPTVRQRGNDQATVVVVKGQGVQAVALAPPEYLDYYGYLVRVFDEQNITDAATARTAAESRVALLKDPFFIESPAGAGLRPTAPVTLEQLIPGAVLRVDAKASCRQVVADFRLERVAVDFSGSVALDLQPLGLVGEGDSSAILT